MTKKDKSLLRWLICNEPGNSNIDMADECNCTVATVRKYRKALSGRGGRT